jgi:hypothetical protein
MRARAIVATICLALSVAVGSASAITKPETLSILEVDESDASTDAGFDFQRFPKPGDQFAFKSGLYSWAGSKRGARIGRDEGICTFTRVPTDIGPGSFSASAHCAASLHLAAGSILVEGFVRFTDGPNNFVLPVVGGTGAYASARGTIHLRDVGSGDSGHTSMRISLVP